VRTSEETTAELVAAAGELEVAPEETALALVWFVDPVVFSPAARAALLAVLVSSHAASKAATANVNVTSSERPANTVFVIFQRPHPVRFMYWRVLPIPQHGCGDPASLSPWLLDRKRCVTGFHRRCEV
jgi:hypothetical protein